MDTDQITPSVNLHLLPPAWRGHGHQAKFALHEAKPPNICHPLKGLRERAPVFQALFPKAHCAVLELDDLHNLRSQRPPQAFEHECVPTLGVNGHLKHVTEPALLDEVVEARS